MAESLTEEEFAKRYGVAFDQAAASPDSKPTEVVPSRAPMSEEEITAYMASPEFQQAREHGIESGAAEAAVPIMEMLATAPLGGLAGRGVLGTAARLGGGSVGTGALAGGEELVRTGDVGHAARVGVAAAIASKVGGKIAEKALGPVLGAVAKPLTKALEAQLKHTIVRGAKVAAEEVAEKAGGEVAQIGAAAARRAAEKAKTALLKEAHDYVTMSAKTSGMSRTGIADALQIRMGNRVEMTASSARKLVDQILGPEPKKLTGNAAIRAAREKLGVK